MVYKLFMEGGKGKPTATGIEIEKHELGDRVYKNKNRIKRLIRKIQNLGYCDEANEIDEKCERLKELIYGEVKYEKRNGMYLNTYKW